MSALDQSPNTFIRCGYCLGMVPSGEVECLHCGAPIPGISPELDFQEIPIDDFIVACHQKLSETGTSAAELAFGVGCTLGVLVSGVLMVLIFLVLTRTWTVLFVILLILTLISFLVSTILAIRARDATTRNTYKREVKPEIDQYISQQGISSEEFFDQAAEVLPASSPLLTYSAAERAQN